LKDLNDALTELGRRAHAQGKVVEIAISDLVDLGSRLRACEKIDHEASG
jgi:hypothetical protein